jgi:hypothetical protein
MDEAKKCRFHFGEGGISLWMYARKRRVFPSFLFLSLSRLSVTLVIDGV